MWFLTRDLSRMHILFVIHNLFILKLNMLIVTIFICFEALIINYMGSGINRFNKSLDENINHKKPPEEDYSRERKYDMKSKFWSDGKPFTSFLLYRKLIDCRNLTIQKQKRRWFMSLVFIHKYMIQIRRTLQNP